ncbi:MULTISPECIES: hypothetical protein [Anaeromassilibacillus]|uniref:hypothetical protein n=1 Tax=Anaeromassilibacillus TaxID=1924093 RepID=UPI0017491B4A|nr:MULTISPECIES: hypothetical protein [Anaeromassilibacillus]
MSGKNDVPDVLTALNGTQQITTKGEALIFQETPLVVGLAISHSPCSSQVQINQPGIYQAAFHSTIKAAPGISIPAPVSVHLYQGGQPVPGAVASHTFSSSREVDTVSFHVSFQVTSAPKTLQVFVDDAGFIFSDSTLTVIRLGATS